MNQLPGISIICPVYKAESYLHKCVDSILAQTFTDWELILVDDGSPDTSGTICDDYAANDSRIRVIHKQNGGVSSARQAGLDVCAFVHRERALQLHKFMASRPQQGSSPDDNTYPIRNHDSKSFYYNARVQCGEILASCRR